MLIEDSKNSDVERWLTGAFELIVSAGSSFSLTVETTDNKRQTAQETRLFIDKRDKYNQQNFLLLDTNNAAVLFKDFQPTDKVIFVRSDRNSDDGFHVFHDPQAAKLPPPPFSSNPPELPVVAQLSEVPLGILEDDPSQFTLNLTSGRYVLCAGNERKIGKTITTADKFFPEVGSIRELIHPLRYITSKVEYETIENNSDPKKLVDNFWIECAGNKDRARELIRIYYSRVREANYYFSSYTEGWRTDRGMVHLIFGHPNVIRKTDESETWIYGEEGNISSITFVFKKSNYGLAGNVYTLIRDPMFRTHWERMVTTWRNGRVYNE
jgi:GWxTD domain-containing protein